MKHIYLPIIGIVGTLLIACSQPIVPPNKIVYNYCDLSQPIYLDKSEIPILTQETKRQILVHNRTWKEKCSVK